MRNLKAKIAKIVRRRVGKWPAEIGVVTFLLAFAFSVISEAASSKSGLTLAIILLSFLITISIIFDGIGVSAASCDIMVLKKAEKNGGPHIKTAIWLVENAEKVNNICADVIGDICGIVSGACSIAIAAKLAAKNDFWGVIMLSSIVAAVTVAGKAYMKTIAVKNAEDVIAAAAKVIYRLNPKHWRKKKK